MSEVTVEGYNSVQSIQCPQLESFSGLVNCHCRSLHKKSPNKKYNLKSVYPGSILVDSVSLLS